jgi:integrase
MKIGPIKFGKNTVCPPTLMAQTQHQNGTLQRVGEALYRYSSNQVYYARIKVDGKEIKRSLETTDRALARRKLVVLKDELRQIDRSQGRFTLEELADRYLETVQYQKPKTVERKAFIVGKVESDWPTGKLTQVGKIKPSDVDRWLSGYGFGSASRNLFIACIKAIFELAIRDRIIAASPAAHLHYAKRAKPIRPTPSYEQFKAIIADVRSQPFNADAQDSADFLEFLGLAGLGQAEASSLTVADIDFDAGRFVTFRHKTSTGFAVPIFPQVRPLLESRCENKANGDLLFNVRDAKKALAGACRRLGLALFSQRSLRRMFITRAIEKGVDVKVIADWQGHRDGGKLILDTYSHVQPIHSQRMAELMSDNEPENVVVFATKGTA